MTQKTTAPLQQNEQEPKKTQIEEEEKVPNSSGQEQEAMDQALDEFNDQFRAPVYHDSNHLSTIAERIQSVQRDTDEFLTNLTLGTNE